MKNNLFILFFLFVTANAFSQGVDNLWILGYDSIFAVTTGRTTLDFSSGTPSVSWSVRPMNFFFSNALISNSNGDLLFYTNGVYIANATNDTMLNGSGLNPSPYTQQENDGLNITQSDIILPFPGDSTKYYLFHETLDSLGFVPLYLYFTIIDLTLDSGRGGVVSKNNILLYHPLGYGGLTACKHANGRDWWLFCHEWAYDYDDNVYVKYLITPNGIQGPFRQSIGKLRLRGIGQVIFSPDGTKFANYEGEDDLDIMDFDRCSGDFSNLIHVAINDSAYPCGVAFSPSSNILYVSSTFYVYQFDLTSGNIPASKTTVAVFDNFASPAPPLYSTFFMAQLAPDGKIYINTGNGTDYLHVINNPDSLGLACNVCQHCIHIPTYNAESIPNYPNYFLGALSGSVCDSLISTNDLALVNNEINIFPNPSSHVLYATINGKFKARNVKIFNAFGQEMIVNFSFIKNGEYLELNTISLSQGVYFLELLSEKEKVVKRFVKE